MEFKVMKKISKKTRNLFLTGLAVFLCGLFIISAGATVVITGPEGLDSQVGLNQDAQTEPYGIKRAKAPEPATVMLFGGGFLGVIASFLRRTYAAMKRLFDMIAAYLGFVILAPLFIVMAVLIKLTSKGPIIYSQERVGRNGQIFKIFKFRTMKVDAEKDTGPVWAAANDNRLTPIGGFLRKTHIDEIPQLINIIKGEMSLIGPRPERPVFVDQFEEIIPNYTKRLEVKPGITGLAQVWHRYDETIEDVKKKLKYDLLYVRKICFLADFRIFFRTFRVVLTGEGAR